MAGLVSRQRERRPSVRPYALRPGLAGPPVSPCVSVKCEIPYHQDIEFQLKDALADLDANTLHVSFRDGWNNRFKIAPLPDMKITH